MASRYYPASASSGHQSCSSEDSDLEDNDWRDSPDKLNIANNELYNEDLEFRLTNQIQTNNQTSVSRAVHEERLSIFVILDQECVRALQLHIRAARHPGTVYQFRETGSC